MGDLEIRNKIRTFVDQYFQSSALRDDDDIFKSGYVNSLFAMQLVLFVEKNYFPVENEDLTLENFHTIDALTAFITRKHPHPGIASNPLGNDPCYSG